MIRSCVPKPETATCRSHCHCSLSRSLPGTSTPILLLCTILALSQFLTKLQMVDGRFSLSVKSAKHFESSAQQPHETLTAQQTHEIYPDSNDGTSLNLGRLPTILPDFLPTTTMTTSVLDGHQAETSIEDRDEEDEEDDDDGEQQPSSHDQVIRDLTSKTTTRSHRSGSDSNNVHRIDLDRFRNGRTSARLDESVEDEKAQPRSSPRQNHRPKLLLNFSRPFHLKDTTKCYSCMSEIYQLQWAHISKTFYRPKNFTSQCDGPYATRDQLRDVVAVECPSICILMVEKMVVGGYEFHGFTRGCYDTLLINGFNDSAVYAYRWMKRDVCRSYDRRMILKLPVRTEGDIHICACFGDLCNSASRRHGAILGGSSANGLRLLLVLSLPLLLMATANLQLCGIV